MQEVTLDSEFPDLSKTDWFPATLTEAEKRMADHPSLVSARYKRDEASAAMRLSQKWNRPKWTVDLSVNSPRNSHNGDLELFKAATVQFSSNLDLFDGGHGKKEKCRISARAR